MGLTMQQTEHEKQTIKMILDLMKAGEHARDTGQSNPHKPNTLWAMLHVSGWLKRDLQLALCRAKPSYRAQQLAAGTITLEGIRGGYGFERGQPYVEDPGEPKLVSHHYDTLREANVARQVEWQGTTPLDLAYRSNEMAGEIGEALEVAVGLLQLGISGGRAANIAKKLERERLGIKGSTATREELADELADIVVTVDLVAHSQGIDLDAAVVRKFNATSDKIGLKTRLVL